MQSWLTARGYSIVRPEDVKLNLDSLEDVTIKNPRKILNLNLQEYALLPHPIATLFGGIIVIHIFKDIKNTQSILLIANEKGFVIGKADLIRVLEKSLMISHTIVITSALSPQASSMSSHNFKHVEILTMNEVLINKLQFQGVPRYQVLNEKQIKHLEHFYKIKRDKLSCMNYKEDAMARYLGFLPGSVVFNMESREFRLVI